MTQEGAAKVSCQMKSCRRQAAHLQLLSEVKKLYCDPLLCGNILALRAAWSQVFMTWWKKIKYWLTSLLKQCQFVWLCCKQIHSQLLSTLALTTCNHGCRQINQHWNLKDYNFKLDIAFLNPFTMICLLTVLLFLLPMLQKAITQHINP